MPSKAELVCVDPKLIHEVWPHARKLIISAIDRTKLSNPIDTEYDILNGDQLLWLAWDGSIKAACSTLLVDGVCVITACGGEDMKQWLPLFSQIEQYAKDQSCRCVRIFGRRGWLRVLDGYQAKHVILERQL
jgi:hypothetical protein